ncbi:MAG: TIR domain-containing protein [Clostridia bacterium]|nr:TIR domain-containing protein [Clostridia bacterium]
MAIFKCKICGGSLEIDRAQSVATCEYCGTKQTLPKLDDERRANLYDRANHFRRNKDFDKAMGIYESILNEDNSDAEAYWSILLCRYGIDYVEDPTTHKRVPTVNRAQFTSIFDDENYKSAITCADGYQREIYEAEAAVINEIQKGILAISQKEDPFDVFICYKESDTGGKRTQDSVLATELYNELTREGFKVFFSRITLEDKLGEAYEPYIFAALQSAKVMVALGTRPEHFNAVWVKNEWSRFLALIKNGAKKTLIPAYRDMDPYDLPEEFSHLQAQDMSKLGFMQDLTRGIKKLVEADAPKVSVKTETVVTTASATIAPLLKRVFLFLEDREFDIADDYCEKILNQDPENAEAYLAKLMVECRAAKREELARLESPFDASKNYQKALRFADASLAKELKGYVAAIKERNAKITEETRKEALYQKALDEYNTYDIAYLEHAIKNFTSLNGYKDSEKYIHMAQTKIEQIRIANEKARIEQEKQAVKARKRRIILSSVLVALVVLAIAFALLWTKVILPNRDYNDAVDMMESGEYDLAIMLFENLEGFRDSKDMIAECQYRKALLLMESGNYQEAITAFTELGEYKDSGEKMEECRLALLQAKYNEATELFDDGLYAEALAIFQTITNYQDSGEKIEAIKTAITEKTYQAALKLKENGKYQEAFSAFMEIHSYKDSRKHLTELSSALNLSTNIDAGFRHTVALKTDGTVVVAGYCPGELVIMDEWQNIVAVSAGDSHTVGLTRYRTVYATGDNTFGQCQVFAWEQIIAISAGANHTVGLKANDTVLATGDNSYGQCDVSDWTDIIAISAGDNHTVALKADGTVVATGDNTYGQCNVSDWNDVIAIYAGASHTFVLKANGEAFFVGKLGEYSTASSQKLNLDNSKGNCIAITSGLRHLAALYLNGTVEASDDREINEYGECSVLQWENIIAISAGAYYTVALKADGTAIATGKNSDQQCDVSQWTDLKTTPYIP